VIEKVRERESLDCFGFLRNYYTHSFVSVPIFVEDSFTGKKSVAIVPTFLVAKFQDIEDLSGMNDMLNALMSMQLPFAVLPVIAMTSSKNVMGEFRNGVVMKVLSVAVAAVIIVINIYFVGYYVTTSFSPRWYIYLSLSMFGVFYLSFILYLLIHMFVSMGFTWFSRFEFGRTMEREMESKILEEDTPVSNYGYDEDDALGQAGTSASVPIMT